MAVSDRGVGEIRPQPIGGGRLRTGLAVPKISLAAAWQVNDRLSIGAALNTYLSRPRDRET